MKFAIQQNTLQGKRHDNQDRMGYIYTKETLLLVVCDGLGGHGDGEKAATWALQTLAHRFQHFANPTIDDPQAFLEASIVSAHGRIFKKTLQEGLSNSPRTTIVCVLIQNGHAWFAHAGDSRAYLMRDRAVFARTNDHSKLQYLIDTGKIPFDQDVSKHPDRNRLINCLGADALPAIEHTGPFTLQNKDTVLLCSDGVWGVLDDDEMLRFIADSDLSTKLPKLVQTAGEKGGEYADDATAIAMRWLSDGVKPEDVIDSRTLENAFESTVHLTLTQSTDMRSMTDEEMDAQIAEINAALARVKQRQGL